VILAVVLFLIGASGVDLRKIDAEVDHVWEAGGQVWEALALKERKSIK
jgi:hypothetical protein